MKRKILNIIEKNGRLAAADVAAMLGESEEEVAAAMAEMEKQGIIGGYHA
ncbi:MAG TPA: AsnC family transcriptional regulator, partial [Lachnospiraceae bacterium]|nr:AsnC family transcriptional regulator [Lachnospiraceae bacterium]